MGDGFSQPEHRTNHKLLQYRNSLKKHLVSELTSEIQFHSLFSIPRRKHFDAILQQQQGATPVVSIQLSITQGDTPSQEKAPARAGSMLQLRMPLCLVAKYIWANEFVNVIFPH